MIRERRELNRREQRRDFSVCKYSDKTKFCLRNSDKSKISEKREVFCSFS
jgi:hypothetical protein